MRHSEAQIGLSEKVHKDFDRPLTDRGISLLGKALDFLKKQHLKPDYIFCSPAVRTKQTLDWIQEAFAHNALIDFPQDLYVAQHTTVLDLIKTAPEQAGCLMVIGHNPSISEVSAILTTNAGIGEEVGETHPLQPGQMSVFRIDCLRWVDVLNSFTTASSGFIPPL